MGFLTEVDLPDSFAPFRLFEEQFGFVPNLFRAQSLVPRLIEAEMRIAEAILLGNGVLTRRQRESLLLGVAHQIGSVYCVTAHTGMLERDPDAGHDPEVEPALMAFARGLCRRGASVAPSDIAALRAGGLADESILEAILVSALGCFVCTLAAGLGPAPDFLPPVRPLRADRSRTTSTRAAVRSRKAARPAPPGILKSVPLNEESFPPFAFFRDRFGFVPNIFRAQTLRPDVVEAEAAVVDAILLNQELLSRVQKESILLVVSAANLNSYCVAVHCELLKGLGVPLEWAEAVAVDPRSAGLPDNELALLEFALALARRPEACSAAEIEALEAHGFTHPQILEAITMTALTGFLNTLQAGLGAVLDFPVRVILEPPVEPIAPRRDPTDDDAELVARSKRGDLDAFDMLVRRHQDGVYRVLLGVTGDHGDAEDCTQVAFVKAYRKLGDFHGHARFSTWLTRIALNEGFQRLRSRRPLESLDTLQEEDGGGMHPRQMQPWEDDPEGMCSRAEIRALVEQELLKVPLIYRTAVILRDLRGLTTREAAKALGVPVPTLKTRLMRGRHILRAALTPHFKRRGGGPPDV